MAHRVRHRGRWVWVRPRGFTLLEMLVVMVLLGLVTSLALPAMQRWHDAVQLRARLAVVVDAMRAAAFAAGATRMELVMDDTSFAPLDREASNGPASSVQAGAAAASAPASPDAPLKPPAPPQAMVPLTPQGKLHVPLPAGWQVDRVEPVRFLANGLCLPGQVRLLTERREMVTVLVRGPVCAVERGSSGDAA